MGLALRWLAVVLLVVATAVGVLHDFVYIALFAYVIVAFVRRIVAAARRQLLVEWVRRPFAREHGLQFVRAVVCATRMLSSASAWLAG